MANTYVKIASATGSGTNIITFSSIPQTYTDLVIRGSVRNTSTTANLRMQINGTSTSLYSQTVLQGNGATASSSRLTNVANTQWNNTSNISTDTANTYGSFELYFPTYTTATDKQWWGNFVTETNGATAYATIAASLFRGGAATTSLSIYYFSGSFDTDSAVYLYGIKNS